MCVAYFHTNKSRVDRVEPMRDDSRGKRPKMKSIFLLIYEIYNLFSYALPYRVISAVWLNRSDSATRIVIKYDNQFKPLLKDSAISFYLLIILAFFYFFPSILYSKYGLFKIEEKTVQDILQLLIVIAGVIFGVFFQQLIQLLLVPD